MPINDLNSQEFSKNLARQAMEFVPKEFPEEQKNYIAKKVYEFSVITGEHLLKQYKEQLDDNQAKTIVQYIAEWTFHKSIDIIKAGIPHEHWDTLLQQVAFAALKAALHSFMQKFEDAKTAAFIEYNVKTAYEENIKQLVNANVIEEKKVDEILSLSNVDQMAGEIKANQSPEEDEKTLKYATIAILLKKLSPEKVAKVLSKVSEEERKNIESCMRVNDLESKLDGAVMNDYIRSLKKNLTANSKPSMNKFHKLFKQLQAKYGEEEIVNLTLFERSGVQHFLSDCLFENVIKFELSPHIVKILYNYLNSKLAASSV